MQENVNESSDKRWKEVILQGPWCTWQCMKCTLDIQESCTGLCKGEHYTWKLRLLGVLLFTCIFLCHIFQKAFPLKHKKINMSLKWIGDLFATFEIFLHFIAEIFFNPKIKTDFSVHLSSFLLIAGLKTTIVTVWVWAQNQWKEIKPWDRCSICIGSYFCLSLFSSLLCDC